MGFIERLKEQLKVKNISVKEIADKLCISKFTIYSWLQGKNMPNNETLIDLANHLEISTDYLLGRTDDPRPFPVEDTRTIDEKWNDPSNEFLYAMYGEVQDLTDEQKEEILNFVDYLKSKSKKDK